MRFARSLVVMLCAFAAACGPKDENKDGIADGIQDPDTVSMVAPSTPVGSVSGQVLDSRYRPLEGVNVSFNIGGPTGAGTEELRATTNASGFYFVRNVPAGAQVLVVMQKDGYAPARTTVTIPASAGNFPINNGNASVNPFILTQLNGQVKFLVVTRSGRPARGARATLEVWPAAMEVTQFTSSPYGSQRGMVVSDTTADDSGLLTFSGIPALEEAARLNGQVILSISPHDENNDGIIDSQGFYQSYNPGTLLVEGAPRTITLPDARVAASFAVVGTNVPSLNNSSYAPADNMLKPSDAIYIAFNQLLEPSSIVARLADETGTQLLATTTNIGPTGTTLIIQPTQGLTVGAEYNLSVRVTSLDNGATLSLNGFIFGGEIVAPKPFALATITYKEVGGQGFLNSGETLAVLFNQPITSYGGGRVFIYFNVDLDGGGTIGNAPGEFGASSSPFELFMVEPPPGPTTGTNPPPPLVVDLKNSGYSTLWQLVMPLNGATSYNITNGTAVRVAFSRNTTVGSGFQTTWAKQITEDVTANFAVAP